MRLRHQRLVTLGLFILFTLPSHSAWAWGFKTHVAICMEAAGAVPDEMKEWKNYAGVLARNTMNPDFWKEGNRQESPRHYIDMDNYVALPLSDIPRSLEEATAKWGAAQMASEGIAPWTIVLLQTRLTQAMSSNQWDEAARLAAAMSHYIGDTHQPLHCTSRFDGPTGPSRGLHARWEENMPNLHWNFRMVKASTPVFIDDPWGSVWQWARQAFTQFEPIFKADDRARKQSHGDTESGEYYQALWTQTKAIFIAQTSQAATDLASFWYTAWVNAGRPAIPAPPANVDGETVWPQDQLTAQKRHSAGPFLTGLAVAAILIVLLSLRKKVN